MADPLSDLLPPPEIDLESLRSGRLQRLRRTMAEDGIDLCVLTNPVSIRYASDHRGYASFQSRIPSSYLLVPKIPYPDDWDRLGYEGEIEEGLVLSVESYVGPAGGTEGVKLEQMVQVTSDGVIPLSSYPFWD